VSTFVKHDPYLIHHLLARAADEHGVRVAVVTEAQRVTYAELLSYSHGIAATLVEQGVQPGDRVVLMLDNSVEFVAAFFGTLLAGAVAVPINPQTRDAKLTFILRDCSPAGFISSLNLARFYRPSLEEVSVRCLIEQISLKGTPQVLPDSRIDTDLAMLIYTSGSTGMPKAVMLSHLNVLSAARSIQAYLQLESTDVILCALPLSFDYGLYQVLLATSIGASVVLELGMTFPARVLERIAQERVTVLPGVPTLFGMLLRFENFSSQGLPALRLVTNTGAALTERLIADLRARLPEARLFSMYGLTECKRVSYLPPEELDRRPGSVGRGMPNQECWLIDGEGNRLPPGSTGELVIRGAHVMLGYWNRPEDTAAAIQADSHTGVRYLRSGDIFRSDLEGFLYFLGRQDDIIKCRGQKVSPKEVENALAALPGVAEVAVMGVPDDLHGQTVKAFVALQSGFCYSAHQILAHCRGRLESHMVPTLVEIRDSLPRSENGKVDRKRLA
jgi:long-chain acyl-CoA synthetase